MYFMVFHSYKVNRRIICDWNLSTSPRTESGWILWLSVVFILMIFNWCRFLVIDSGKKKARKSISALAKVFVGFLVIIVVFGMVILVNTCIFEPLRRLVRLSEFNFANYTRIYMPCSIYCVWCASISRGMNPSGIKRYL